MEVEGGRHRVFLELLQVAPLFVGWSQDQLDNLLLCQPFRRIKSTILKVIKDTVKNFP